MQNSYIAENTQYCTNKKKKPIIRKYCVFAPFENVRFYNIVRIVVVYIKAEIITTKYRGKKKENAYDIFSSKSFTDNNNCAAAWRDASKKKKKNELFDGTYIAVTGYIPVTTVRWYIPRECYTRRAVTPGRCAHQSLCDPNGKRIRFDSIGKYRIRFLKVQTVRFATD